jgi:hypothetical protein
VPVDVEQARPARPRKAAIAAGARLWISAATSAIIGTISRPARALVAHRRERQRVALK